jgi:hypothetical protein
MSVRVIKEGKLPAKDEYYLKCNNCKCEFEFLREDTGVAPHYDQRDGNYLSIDCPTCKQTCTIAIHLTKASRQSYGEYLGH